MRNETNKLVTDLVDFDRVQSLLLMISHRRRYLAMKEQARLEKFVQQGNVYRNEISHAHDTDRFGIGLPDIVVSGGEPVTPPSTTRDITTILRSGLPQCRELKVPVRLILDNDYVVQLTKRVDFFTTLNGRCAPSGILTKTVFI